MAISRAEQQFQMLEELSLKAEQNREAHDAKVKQEQEDAAAAQAEEEAEAARAAAESESEEDKAARIAEEERVASEASAPAGKRTAKVKINGVEEEIEIDDMVSKYQKLLHADREMERAALARKEIEVEHRKLDLMRQEMLDMREKAVKELEQGPKAKPLPSAEDAVAKAVKDLFDGDGESAPKSLDEAINARVQAELDRRLAIEATKIKDQTSAEMRKQIAEANSQSRFTSAIEQAFLKNPEIFNDQLLTSAWENQLSVADMGGATPEQAVASATQHVNEFMSRFKTAEPAKAGFNVTEAELRAQNERKEAAKKFEVNGKAAPVVAKEKTERDPTPTEVFNEMKALREAPHKRKAQ